MSPAPAIVTKGWCPGALRPMLSGDGLLVRVRPRSGAISLDALRAVCDAAIACGNGQIEITRRANLQIRGVREAKLSELIDALAVVGLLDGAPEAEAMRNIVSSPFSGIDAAERFDMRPLAHELEAAISTDPALWRLPAKFGFVLDGGGSACLDDVGAHVRLLAVPVDGAIEIAIGVAGREGTDWICLESPAAAISAAVEIAKRLDGATGRRHVAQTRAERDARSADRRWLGVRPLPDGRALIGIAAAFGRLDSMTLRELADASRQAGCDELRLSPWRALYAVASSPATAADVVKLARDRGLIVDDADPLLAVDACPGAPSCVSATFDTRSLAHRLASVSSQFAGAPSIHVSGCAKGCARSSAADLVLVGQGDAIAVIRNGRADSRPTRLVALDDVARLPRIVRELMEPEHNA